MIEEKFNTTLCLDAGISSSAVRRTDRMNTIRASLQLTPVFQKKRQSIKFSINKSEQSSNSDLQDLFSSEDTIANVEKLLEAFQEKYELLEKIGEGTCGVVYSCKKRSSGEMFAAKSFVFQDEHVPGLKTNFLQHRTLDHPNIITYEAIYLDMKKHQGWLVMEYLPWKELGNVRHRGQDQLMVIFQQLLSTLSYLHSKKIVHRDIKPENVMYCKETKMIKLIDFGIARKFRRRGILTDMWTITGTLFYRAPEMFAGGYREGIDIWAVAVLIFKLVSDKTPFQSHYHHETIKKITSGKLNFPACFNSYSSQMKSLLKRMLHRNPQERPSASTCLKDVWFYSIGSIMSQNIGSLCQLQQCVNQEFEQEIVRGRRSTKTPGSLKLIKGQQDDSLKPITILCPNTFVELRHTTGQTVFCLDSEREVLLVKKSSLENK